MLLSPRDVTLFCIMNEIVNLQKKDNNKEKCNGNSVTVSFSLSKFQSLMCIAYQFFEQLLQFFNCSSCKDLWIFPYLFYFFV
jgi:hypothetical protein